MICSAIPAAAYAQGTETQGVHRNAAYTLYVSTDGRDDGHGTEQNPFRTIEQARDAVRDLDKTNGDIVVKIAGGTYYLDSTIAFTEADSGNENCTIYYEAADGENPVISGGERVTGDWREEGNGTYSIPYNRDTKLRSLYVNGERAYMTQKESQGRGNYGSYTVDTSKDWAWIPGTTAAGTQLDNGAIPLDTRNQDDIELMTQTTWNTAIVCVDNLQDIGNGCISANYQMPYGAVAQQPKWDNYYKSGGWQTMYNVFEWLPDSKGHFYFDKTTKRLYYCPRDGEDMTDLEVIVPKLETLVDLSGSSTTSRIGYITFSGLEFAHSDWNLYELAGSYGRATVQGAAGMIYFADGDWHPSIYRAYDVGPGAVMVNSAQHIAFYGNTICHTGNDGLSFVNDVVDSIASGNLIYDIAGAGFLLGHPQHVYIGDKGSDYGLLSEKEKYDVGVEGACKRIKLTNNFISDTCLMFWGDSGVMVFMAEEFEMKYNHLQNTPYSGVSIGWSWWNMDGSPESVVPGVPTETTKNNTIMYNTFKNTITKLGDTGAIYTIGNMPGTVISENYIWSIGTPGVDPSYHIRGIHPDEGTRHVYGEKNVIEISSWFTCIDCSSWGKNGYNTWDNNYATSSSYSINETWEEGTVATNAHTSLDGIWGTDVFDIVKNAGIQSDYYSIIPESMFGLQDRLLPNKIYAARQELDWGAAVENIEGEIWLAPEGTEEFVASDVVVQVKDGKVTVPAVSGIYNLYIVNGKEVSAPSSGQVIVEACGPIRNVVEGERKKTSSQKPFAIELETRYHKDFELRNAETPDVPGEKISDGHKITEAGSFILQAKDLNNTEVKVNFHVYVNLADNVFPKNIQLKPGNSVRLDTNGMDGETAWFVPEGMAIHNVSQLIESEKMTKAESDASKITAPAEAGNYRLYLVKDDLVSEASDALLTVFEGDLPITDGLLVRFDAEDIESGTGTAVSEWQDTTKQYSLVQTEAGRRPAIRKTENNMAYLSFDGSDDYLQLREDQEIDLNRKSNLTIITLSAYKGSDPPTGTYGDERTTVFFAQDGDWGSLYMSNYAGFMVSRFGSGQSGNYNKYMRPASTSRFTTAAMVKDGKMEYLYDDGKKVYTNTNRYEQTGSLQKSMMVGITKQIDQHSYANIDISEILIYDRTLSDEEIEKIYDYTRLKQQASLESISVKLPAKTVYTVGEELELTEMKVTARYKNGRTKVIAEGYTVTGYDKDRLGEQTITISYTEKGVVKTAAFTVTVRSAVDLKVTNVEDLIGRIGVVAYNNTSEAKIEAAENAYKKLTPQQQASVSNYDVLKNARAKYDALKADAEKRAADQEAANRVSSLISGIGTVSAGSKAKIDSAEKAYNALTADQKKLVKNYSVLTSAKAAYQKITALPKKGEKFLVGGLWYQVTKSDAKNGTVSVIKEKSKKRKSINIKSTVKIKGYTFKITAIGKKAFYKNKGLTSIKVGKNIVKIDSYAFYGCTKLKSVKIYSTKLKTVGKKAFGKTEKNIVVQVPKKTKKLLKKYKSLLRKKGISKYTVFRY